MPSSASQLSNEVVNRHYLGILRREPSQTELRLWVGAAGIQRSKEALASTLIRQATEVRSIARHYAGLMGRFPDGLDHLPTQEQEDGLTYWTNILRAFRAKHRGLSYREALRYCIEDWFKAPEHLILFPSDLTAREFAERLCLQVTGSPLKTGDAWIPKLDEMERTAIAVELAEGQAAKQYLNDGIDRRLLSAVDDAPGS